MPLRRLWLIVALIPAVMLACGPAEAPTDALRESSHTDDEGQLLMVNRIAYIDNTGDLLLINPDGTGERRLTGDFMAGLLSQALERGDSYAWPTWSPDGGRIAVSQVSASGEGAALSIQVFDLSAESMTPAYENELMAPVAEGTPHYLYWAPDGQHLSFLAPMPNGLTLFVRGFQEWDESWAAAVGAPLYYHWTADAKLVAVHSGDRVAVREAASGGGERRVAVDAVAFRAPAVSPDGSQLAYAGFGGGVRGVFLAPMDSAGSNPSGSAGNAPRLLMETQGLTAFAWAPDGSVLAVAEQLRGGAPVFDRVVLLSADGAETALLFDERVLAFFWSPQGDRIAWVGLDPQSRSMDISVSSVEGGKPVGEPRHLFRFSPTGEMFTLLSFFDQYAYSHSIWSPDGSALAVAGTDGLESARRNGSGPHGGQVYVVDADSGEARRIASGKLAVWSWN